MSVNGTGVWGRANISPQDWIGILEFEISSKNENTTLKMCVDWLFDKGAATEQTGISRLKKIESLTQELSHTQIKIIKTIIENVSFKSVVLYFEKSAYKCLKFFTPAGNPKRIQESYLPDGIYQSVRFSFSQPGKLIFSAFSFYRNDRKNEVLSGYGDNISVDDEFGLSNVYRFKEIRHINPDGVLQYKIFSGGFVFANRGGFVLIGSSYEVHSNVKEYKIAVKDLSHVQPVIYFMEDDNNRFILRGIKPTILRGVRKPAAAKFIMEKIPGLAFKNWNSIEENDEIKMGIFSKKEISSEKWEKYIEFLKGKIDDELNMYMIR